MKKIYDYKNYNEHTDTFYTYTLNERTNTFCTYSLYIDRSNYNQISKNIRIVIRDN